MRRQTFATDFIIFAKAVPELRFAIRPQRHAIGRIGQVFDDPREGQNALAEKLPYRSGHERGHLGRHQRSGYGQRLDDAHLVREVTACRNKNRRSPPVSRKTIRYGSLENKCR